MRYDLATMARRKGIRRKVITFAAIIPTKAQKNALAAIYNRMLAPWLEAVPAITQAYSRELSLTTDSVDDLGALFDALGNQVQRLVLELTPALRDWAFSLEAWHRGRWQNTVLSGAGVDISTLIGPQDVAESLQVSMARNVALVRDISAQAQTRIADAVLRGYQARTPANEVAKQITEATGMGRSRARRVASDQTVKLASALDRQRQRQALLDDWKWRHSGKLHPRENHKARDGKLYNDDTAPADEPGELPFCGCVRQGVLLLGDEPVEAPPPPPVPVQRGFRSPIDQSVTASSIRIDKRLKVTKEMSQGFAKAAQDKRYSPEREFRDRKVTDFGRAQYSAAFDDETVSMLKALKPELDDLARQLDIPAVRGFKSISGTKAVANMGDGVMGINPAYFNNYAARIGGRQPGEALAALNLKTEGLATRAKQLGDEATVITKELAGLSPADPRYQALLDAKARIYLEHQQLRKEWLALGKKKLQLSGAEEKPVSEWKPGDDPKNRPYTIDPYFTGVDKARAVLFHEFGHHVHQYLRKEGLRRTYGPPPLERDLRALYAQAMARGSGKQASKYATTNPHEWFAENFSLFAMGRRDLVDEETVDLMKKLFDGSY